MSPSRSQQVRQAFSAALKGPRADRRRRAEEACGGDLELVQEVLSLLESSDEADSSRFMNDAPTLFVPGDPATHDTAIPATIGRYEVECEIGRGGMGVVYKARDPDMPRFVAIKRLDPRSSPTPALAARFKQEVAAMGRLEHENVVRAYDVFESEGSVCLVMEYVDGSDLESLVHRCGPRPLSEVCDLIRQAALGLQYAHEKGIVHRDVKPSNLLLSGRGQVKLLDLGLARCSLERPDQPGLTAPGDVWGSLDYMAPEQQDDMRQVDIRADVYSLGCTLYFLVTGRPPFGDRSLSGKLRAHREEPPPALESPHGPVPEGLAAIYRRMAAKRPEDRYATPGDVARAIEELTLAARQPAGDRPAPIPRAKTAWLRPLALATVVAGLAAFAWWQARPGAGPGQLHVSSPSPSQPVAPGNGPARTTQRVRVPPAKVFAAMREHLARTAPNDREHRRFFILVHLHNNPQVSAESLAGHVSALRDVLTWLAPAGKPIEPDVVDGTENTVYAMDLRGLGWADTRPWRALLAAPHERYPFALDYATPMAETPVRLPDKALEAARAIPEMTGWEQVPYVRADWFIVQATRPQSPAARGRQQAVDSAPPPDSSEWVRHRYHEPLGIQAVSSELGVEDPALLGQLIRGSPDLQALGLDGLLAPEGAIPRAKWSHVARDSSDSVSLFQKTAGKLGLGNALIPWE